VLATRPLFQHTQFALLINKDDLNPHTKTTNNHKKMAHVTQSGGEVVVESRDQPKSLIDVFGVRAHSPPKALDTL
jgi:hypothetical protein